MDIFAAAGLAKPDISILSDGFLSEVRGMSQRNLAIEMLQRLLKGELRTRRRKKLVQVRSFAELLEQSLRRPTALIFRSLATEWMVCGYEAASLTDEPS